jgi:glycogen synthase
MTVDTVGGVWTYALELSRALAPRGVEIVLATMGPLPDDGQRAAAASAGVDDVRGSSFALEWEDDPWHDVDRAGAWLLELEEEVEPDLVHLNGYAHGSLPWRAPSIVVAHSDVVSWWWAVHGEPPPERYDAYRSAVEAGLRAARAVVAPTRAVLADLERHYRFRGTRLVVPNGRDAAGNTPVKEPFVLGLGRFGDAAKNLSALEAARASCPWPVVVAGDGTAMGRVDACEAADLLRRAAVFAAPARYEPFGLAALEAALAGCALVLGDVPSLREVWGEAALFVPPDEHDALAAALRLLARDAELRAELAHRARRRAVRYTPERMADGYLALYERTLEAVPA